MGKADRPQNQVGMVKNLVGIVMKYWDLFKNWKFCQRYNMQWPKVIRSLPRAAVLKITKESGKITFVFFFPKRLSSLDQKC